MIFLVVFIFQRKKVATLQINFIPPFVKGNFLLENQNHESIRKTPDRHGQKAFTSIRGDKNRRIGKTKRERRTAPGMLGNILSGDRICKLAYTTP
jgi:hypothetical protein